jgi:broad specificity phosphatase PhoE
MIVAGAGGSRPAGAADMLKLMTTNFVIVQHGEKESHPGDPGLTVVGQRQAAAAARVLAELAPVAVYSSGLRRAFETAACIAAELGLDVTRDPALTERMNWTQDSGMSIEEFLTEWQRATGERTYRPRHGDSSADAGARFEQALLSYAEEHPVGAVVCVTHGGVTTDLLRNLLGDERLRSLAPDLIERGVPGGALTTVRREMDQWHVETVAVIDHIPERDRTGHRLD